MKKATSGSAVTKRFAECVRSAAASSPADELAKLHGLRVKGVLSDAEHESAKARLL